MFHSQRCALGRFTVSTLPPLTTSNHPNPFNVVMRAHAQTFVHFAKREVLDRHSCFCCRCQTTRAFVNSCIRQIRIMRRCYISIVTSSCAKRGKNNFNKNCRVPRFNFLRSSKSRAIRSIKKRRIALCGHV